MFGRISNGIALAGSSWRVLWWDKHLLAFPIVSGLLFVVVTVSFAIPLATIVDWSQVQHTMEANNGQVPLWIYGVAFAFYFCTYCVGIFCNAALVSCALLRFHGETPTVADGLRAAAARFPQIVAWAFVSATVGVLLKAIENAHEKAGSFMATILGAAWSVMTFFVVPVLVVEKVGPVEAIRRSITLLKKTWGEALVGRIGLGFVMFLLAIPILLLLVAGVYLLATGMTAPGAALLIMAIVAFLLHMAIGAALQTILLAALYQYAADNQVPEGFDRQAIEGAFGHA